MLKSGKKILFLKENLVKVMEQIFFLLEIIFGGLKWRQNGFISIGKLL